MYIKSGIVFDIKSSLVIFLFFLLQSKHFYQPHIAVGFTLELENSLFGYS